MTCIDTSSTSAHHVLELDTKMKVIAGTFVPVLLCAAASGHAMQAAQGITVTNGSVAREVF